VLEQYGLVRQSRVGGPQPIAVRLLALPERISRELTALPDRLAFLRRLWRAAGGARLHQGVQLDARVLDRAAGGRGAALPLLQALSDTGFIAWSAPSGEGIWVLDRDTPLARLPVDWRSLDERKRRELGKLKQMQGYAYADGCRRGYVLRYFGDPAAMAECGACDNCLGSGPVRDRRPTPARSRVGAELDAEHHALFQRLREVRRDLAERHGLPAHRIVSEPALLELARGAPETPDDFAAVPGIPRRALDRYGLTLLNAIRGHRGRPELDALADSPPPRRRRAIDSPTGPEAELYGRLRELRMELARDANLPAYCVFHDRVLVEIARQRPSTADQLLAIPGVGPAKLERFGEAFLAALQGS
jgi:ATP-dependent DNA helicase RecQ